MSVLDSKTILPEFIKLRWNEPYVSSALNRKSFKTQPRGIYNGFVVKPGPGAHQIQVAHDDPAGWGLTSGYGLGDFDQASGWSTAVHASSIGFSTNIVMQAGPGRNFIFDTLAYAGTTVFVVMDVQYFEGIATEAQVKIVQAADLDVKPDLLVLARVDVPGSGNVSSGNIHYDDVLYPRVLPFATPNKYGFMSPQQVQTLHFLESVSGSPAFNYEVLISVDGPQTVLLPPGYIYTVGADDLWVHKNGLYATKGASRDYLEVDRGDGHGTQISWVGIIRAGDRVKFRIQKYASVATSTLQVFDEHALINPNVVFMNFSGSGVTVLPDGPTAVKVRINGGGGAGGGAIKSCFNSSGAPILFGYAVTKKTDNTIIPCDPKLGHHLYGVTTLDIPNGIAGNVQTGGIVPDVPTVSGFAIMDDLFVSMDGRGTITNVAPDPVSGSVIRIGFADGDDGVSGMVPSSIVFDRGRLT